ncbi:uncharacterized protein LOC141525815 [Cotesia typhae]|uniref:uncharacterized protein LOC141525815 n=1 Tax=Cotesia typhae TaxID=2053667 RepID=UPI003D6901D3
MTEDPEPQTLTGLLNEWKISEDVIKTFNDNGITIDLLYELTAANLKELCPHLATRVLLKKKIKEYLEANDEQESDPTDDNDAAVRVLPNNVQSLSEIPDYFPELDLGKLLTESPEGCNVLRDYQATQILSPANQQLLVKVLICGLFPWLQTNMMKEHHYLSLIKKIHVHFPQEPLGVYYMSPVPKHSSSTNKAIPMRGKLVDKVKNTLFTTGIGRKRKLGNVTASVEEKQRRYNEFAATHQEDLEWLKNNREPWNDVQSKWLNTFDLRVNSKFDSVHEFIQEWNILNDLRSKSLISLDFEKLYPNKGARFATEWPKFFDRVKMLRIDKYTNDKIIQKKKRSN